jgi:hypothetical protein
MDAGTRPAGLPVAIAPNQWPDTAASVTSPFSSSLSHLHPSPKISLFAFDQRQPAAIANLGLTMP